VADLVKTKTVWKYGIGLTALLSLFFELTPQVAAEPITPRVTSGFIEDERRPRPSQRSKAEPAFTGWAFHIDNDLLTPVTTDRDYTAGFALTMSGSETKDYSLSIDSLLGWIDDVVIPQKIPHTAQKNLHSFEIGMNLFTPSDINKSIPDFTDRPYASLVYVANTHQRYVPHNQSVLISTLSLGILGSRFPGELQSGVHKLIDVTEPKGWDNQISPGGELTARYALSSQRMFYSGELSGGSRYDVTTAIRGAIGYITEVSIGISSRVGDIYSDWWSFNPNLSDYAEKSLPIAASTHQKDGRQESYFWYGANLRLRLYNAFLQGQFRDSSVTINRGDINPLLAEAWAGYTKQIESDWRLSYLVRAQTPEIRIGNSDRTGLWGGVIIGRSF